MIELLHVEEAGLLTTVQDLGRMHAVASGVPAGGAMDRFAHTAANLLVGNDRGAATLECTLRGPRLRALRQCVIAVTGADFELSVNGNPAAMWTSLPLSEGDELAFGTRRSGARAYIAVAGGLNGDRWLGSLSTNLLVARGGMHGRALRKGDVIAAVAEPDGMQFAERRLRAEKRPVYSDHTLRVVAGPHLDRVTAPSRDELFGSAFHVGRDSDRMGYRLDGPTVAAPGEELLSFGLVTGALQAPGGGGPILLMADHHTAGGYPVVGVVVTSSLPVAGQLLPGDELRFELVDLETALRLRADQRAALLAVS